MTPLTYELRADIREYFKNPEEVLKCGLQIMTFQEGTIVGSHPILTVLS